jgi:hypothetical protein
LVFLHMAVFLFLLQITFGLSRLRINMHCRAKISGKLLLGGSLLLLLVLVLLLQGYCAVYILMGLC